MDGWAPYSLVCVVTAAALSLFFSVSRGNGEHELINENAKKKVEADDFSHQLYNNVNAGSYNPLFDHEGKAKYVSVLRGELKYNSASHEASRAKYTYVVSYCFTTADDAGFGKFKF